MVSFTIFPPRQLQICIQKGNRIIQIIIYIFWIFRSTLPTIKIFCYGFLWLKYHNRKKLTCLNKKKKKYYCAFVYLLVFPINFSQANNSVCQKTKSKTSVIYMKYLTQSRNKNTITRIFKSSGTTKVSMLVSILINITMKHLQKAVECTGIKLAGTQLQAVSQYLEG